MSNQKMINQANTWPKVFLKDGLIRTVFSNGAVFLIPPDVKRNDPPPTRAATFQAVKTAHFNIMAKAVIQPDGRVMTDWGQAVKLRSLTPDAQFYINKIDKYK